MSERFEIVSPVDGSVYANLPYADDATVDAAVTRAHAAQRDWSRTDLGTRAERCQAFVRAMERVREGVAAELAWLMGRPVRFGPSEVTRLGERATHMIAIAEQSLAPIEIAQSHYSRNPQTPGNYRGMRGPSAGVRRDGPGVL